MPASLTPPGTLAAGNGHAASLPLLPTELYPF